MSSGPNAVFGCLVEKNVVIAVDTSGSMYPHSTFFLVVGMLFSLLIDIIDITDVPEQNRTDTKSELTI